MRHHYYGGQKLIEHYKIMGPVKAAPEAVVHEHASEPGPQYIRIHAVSPGPIPTRVAAGIDHFDKPLEHAAQRAPQPHRVNVDEVGAVAAGPSSDWARRMTANVVFVDGGSRIMG